MIRMRQGMVQRTEAEKKEAEHQLVSLSQQANDLRQLLDKVTPRHGAHPAHFSTLAPGPLLKAPIAGRVVKHYGERDADGVTSDGLMFAGLPGAPVVAPRAGRVVFAGPFKGFGQIVILQHEGGYHSLLAGFGRIDAEMAQNVEAGEPLGVLPVKSGAKPQLYFEWRRGDEPADPGIGG
jgi:septal ring factor EnvC (AmiA/AmiB activator)